MSSVPTTTTTASTTTATTTATGTHAAVDRVARAYLDHLAVERGSAANTLLSYRRDLRRYKDYLAARGVSELDAVTGVQIGEFLAHLREGDDGHPPLSASSSGRAVVAVRGLHRFALREGVVSADVARAVSPPVPAKRLPKAIPVADVERLLEAASLTDTPLSVRDRALLELLYGTGARISEAVGLELDDLDLTGRTVLLAGKGGKQRRVPVGTYAVAAVEAYLVRARPLLAAAATGATASRQVFLNARGGPLSRQSAWAVLRAAAERAGLRGDLSPHTLRHSYATHLIEGGANVREVQELLGHASVTTTQIYTQVTVDALREVFAAAHPRAR